MPVSYTHLDVYKRQLEEGGEVKLQNQGQVDSQAEARHAAPFFHKLNPAEGDVNQFSQPLQMCIRDSPMDILRRASCCCAQTNCWLPYAFKLE